MTNNALWPRLELVVVCLLGTALPLQAAIIYSGPDRNVTYSEYVSPGAFSLFDQPETWDDIRLDVHVHEDPEFENTYKFGNLVNAHGNFIYFAEGDDHPDIKRLDAGDLIDGTLTFMGDNYRDFSSYREEFDPDPWVSEHGEFRNQTGYAGFRMIDGEDIYYGWIQVRVQDYDNSNITGTLIDWAYEDNPGESIVAGAIPDPTPTPTPSATVTVTPTPYPTPEYVVIESGDYSGDGRADIAVFRPATGLWAVRGLGRVYFGRAGDIPASGDYDGGGITDVAVFRPETGLWAVKDLTRFYFGNDSDIPVPGDYGGDGVAAAVFQPDAGRWAVRGLTRVYFGREGDLPVPADYTGDGVREIAVFRPSSGLWAVRDLTRAYFGTPGDRPVPGVHGWYASGKTASPFRATIAVFRPSSGLWAIRGLTRVYFGTAGDSPVTGDFTGTRIDELGIFRPASGLWAIRGLTRVYFGTPGDLPATR